MVEKEWERINKQCSELKFFLLKWGNDEKCRRRGEYTCLEEVCECDMLRPDNDYGKRFMRKEFNSGSKCMRSKVQKKIFEKGFARRQWCVGCALWCWYIRGLKMLGLWFCSFCEMRAEKKKKGFNDSLIWWWIDINNAIICTVKTMLWYDNENAMILMIVISLSWMVIEMGRGYEKSKWNCEDNTVIVQWRCND